MSRKSTACPRQWRFKATPCWTPCSLGILSGNRCREEAEIHNSMLNRLWTGLLLKPTNVRSRFISIWAVFLSTKHKVPVVDLGDEDGFAILGISWQKPEKQSLILILKQKHILKQRQSQCSYKIIIKRGLDVPSPIATYTNEGICSIRFHLGKWPSDLSSRSSWRFWG